MPKHTIDPEVRGLSKVALMLLVAGAAHPDGRPNGLRREDVLYAPELEELRERGLLRWYGGDPHVTDAGRAAINAPSESEVLRARFRADHPWIEMLRQDNGGVMPRSKVEDHISNAVYRNYQTMDMVAVPIVRMSDDLTRNGKIYASRDGSPATKFYIDPKRMIDQPEGRGDLILTLIPRWLCRWISAHFDQTNMLGVTPDLVGDDWTDAHRKRWTSLIGRARTVNIRIADGGNRQYVRRRYGETA